MPRSDRSAAARKAWRTRQKPTYRAARAERLSKEALEAWARIHRFHVVLLDGPSGKPRTGIVDALLIRHRKSNADAFAVYAVQLKGGQAGMTTQEMTRLKKAAGGISVQPLVVLHDAGGMLHFLPVEP